MGGWVAGSASREGSEVMCRSGGPDDSPHHHQRRRHHLPPAGLKIVPFAQEWRTSSQRNDTSEEGAVNREECTSEGGEG